jgi:hypothetical protein
MEGYIFNFERQTFISYLQLVLLIKVEPGSSVSIVSGYGLDDRAFEVWSPAGAKWFFLYGLVQAGSGVRPDSCAMGTGGPFPGAKSRPGRDADHSPPFSAEVENE